MAMQDQAIPTHTPTTAPGHRRHKSAAVLRSIISSKGHKPPQDGTWATPHKGLHKKTPSSASLRSLAACADQPRDSQEPSEARRPRNADAAANKPKKAKSSTNLAAMFGKSRSRDRQLSPVKGRKDKENTAPPSGTASYGPPPTPIWAEFSSRAQATTTAKVPLNDHGPSQKRSAANERPKSMVVPKTTSTASLFDTLSRKKSGERVPLSDTKGNESRQRDSSPTKDALARPTLGRASTETSGKDIQLKPMAPLPVATKKPNRVMAAVAAFNGKAKQTEPSPVSPTKLDPKVVDAEFEEVLVSSSNRKNKAANAHNDRNHETFRPINGARCVP